MLTYALDSLVEAYIYNGRAISKTNKVVVSIGYYVTLNLIKNYRIDQLSLMLLRNYAYADQPLYILRSPCIYTPYEILISTTAPRVPPYLCSILNHNKTSNVATRYKS
jgi:hypothetical protein